MQMATLWRTLSPKSSSHEPPSVSDMPRSHRLSKSSSVKVAASLTRVCLCAPISSYKEVFRADMQMQAPRRSNSYPRAKPSSSPPPRSGRHGGIEGRRVIFRGKSLMEDVLMRRFVVEEEAVRRRNQMEAIRRRSATRRKKLGPSRLRTMLLAHS